MATDTEVSVCHTIAQEVKAAVVRCFDEDTTGEVQLHRFHSTRDLFMSTLAQELQSHREEFEANARAWCQSFAQCKYTETLYLGVLAAKGALSDCIAECMLILVAERLLRLRALEPAMLHPTASQRHTYPVGGGGGEKKKGQKRGGGGLAKNHIN